ncbi:unnamed protein product [Phaedon cochleariae]|uniref:Programmed cell death protein 2 C-terminal domain-containing protein n=1 Tax=Phaedon cochleariae TaxID=80249 RepID=A0A9N9SDA7_PHACE|nr:unnamed protein product [Phaedon cochleariae]
MSTKSSNTQQKIVPKSMKSFMLIPILTHDVSGGAVGRLNSPAATAEIEGDEGEVVSIDTPTYPQRDITALLQEVTPLPHDICQSDSRRNQHAVHFTPYFMSVWEEGNDKYAANISDRHVKELLQEYQQKNEEITNLSSPEGGGGGDCGSEVFEKYEKSNPAHGDKMFHNFLTKIQANSGQILRYCRESTPLLLHPLTEPPFKQCPHCRGETAFEFQLLPTIISKLQLTTDAKPCARLDFGTVLVYTCRRSCWTADGAPRSEGVVVQSEVY